MPRGRDSRSIWLRCQPLQDVLAQLLRFAEKFLVFEKDAVQFERLVGGELAAQHHVAHMDGIGEGRVFGQFFEGGCWIVVVHTGILPLETACPENELSGPRSPGVRRSVLGVPRAFAEPSLRDA